VFLHRTAIDSVGASGSQGYTMTVYPGPAPAVTSVVVNGGPIYAVDALGNTPDLLGQNSVVEQRLVTFN
jgi:hypothetical protein